MLGSIEPDCTMNDRNGICCSDPGMVRIMRIRIDEETSDQKSTEKMVDNLRFGFLILIDYLIQQKNHVELQAI